MTITQQAEQFTSELQTLKTQLEDLINCDYYQQLSSTGFYIVEVTLVDALQAFNETQEFHEWVKTCLETYPGDNLKSAIAKTLENVNPCSTNL